MDRTFSPCALSGVAAVPPSKSEAHRRMICAALTPGETRLTGFLPSRDMTATMDCLSALGAPFRLEGETLLVRGCGGPAAFAPRMDCGESGSTLRFLIPLALALGEGGGFLMGGRLGERPLEPYDPILEACGVTSRRESTPQGVLLTLRGRLRPGNYTLPGDVSSQFVTGMLYALPLLPGDSTLTVTPPVESAGYIRMTLQCLADSGIRLEETGPYAWRIPGNQRYRATGGALPGDWSQGAVLLCAGALGHPVSVAGLDTASTQGDRAALDVLARLGVSFREEDGVLHPLGGTLRGATFSGRDIPDIVPVLALTCTQAADFTLRPPAPEGKRPLRRHGGAALRPGRGHPRGGGRPGGARPRALAGRRHPQRPERPPAGDAPGPGRHGGGGPRHRAGGGGAEQILAHLSHHL